MSNSMNQSAIIGILLGFCLLSSGVCFMIGWMKGMESVKEEAVRAGHAEYVDGQWQWTHMKR